METVSSKQLSLMMIAVYLSYNGNCKLFIVHHSHICIFVVYLQFAVLTRACLNLHDSAPV